MSRHNRERRLIRKLKSAPPHERVGSVRIDGRAVPVLLPSGDWADPGWEALAFDAALIDSGLRQFVRPLTASDLPHGIDRPPDPPAGRLAVLVTRESADAIDRRPLVLPMPPDN